MDDVVPGSDADADAVRRWAASGCMHLSGPAAAGGSGPPAGLVPLLDDLASRITCASATIGERVAVDPLAVLAHRAALRGWRRNGRSSCNRATRLLAARREKKIGNVALVRVEQLYPFDDRRLFEEMEKYPNVKDGGL